jgi:NAD+ synthase (glutamine-hydrolysing)
MDEGGTRNQDTALAGAQARTRMALSYFVSQLALEKKNRTGFLLKLASLHLDYLLRGYFTKYDCSSADLNPIGSFSTKRIKEFLIWNSKLHDFNFIYEVLEEK